MTAKGPSKNSKCPCGSGKKYRKCHGLRKRVISSAKRLFADRDRATEDYRGLLGHARMPVTAMMGDKRVVAIGGTIYMQSRVGDYGIANLAHDCALELFGTDLVEQEERLPLNDRHPALQWMFAFVEYNEHQLQMGVGSRRPQTGAGASWFRMGYDLFTIRDNSTLLGTLRDRLLDVKTFQGARHELAVAAICVAAGFDLQYEDESDNQKKHPEFIGSDRLTGAQIAVEAKSRHRRGVKSFVGGRAIPADRAVDIRGIVLDAYRKTPPLPTYVFVDVNMPPADEGTYQGWQQEINQTMSDLSSEGYADPCPANAVFFTNDPSHYAPDREIDQSTDGLWFIDFMASSPRIPHPTTDMVARFLKAYTVRHTPPNRFLEQP